MKALSSPIFYACNEENGCHAHKQSFCKYRINGVVFHLTYLQIFTSYRYNMNNNIKVLIGNCETSSQS